MELKFVIPNMEKTFGNLEFAGEDKVVQRRINGRLTVLSRSYNLYSDVQRADDIVVVLPAEAGEKHFGFEERVKRGKMMRLANGIVLDKDTTFGELKFSALRREVRIQNEDGSVSDEIKERTYDLKSKGQGRMFQVSIPASVPLKEFDYNARVELINPIADTVATATYQGADVDWYIKADDIVLTKDSSSFKAQPQAKKEPTQDK